jgi:anti-sigma regulatory factor (Ser/Thr protein kinase)
MPDSLPAPLALDVPTNLVFVRPVRKMLEGLLYAMEWVEDDVDDACLILTEILQNAVEHGSRADGQERVQVLIHAKATGVDMRVEDPGTGEDPRAALVRDVETPVPLEEPRGRGLYLIHRMATSFERSLLASGGLCVAARKECGAP